MFLKIFTTLMIVCCAFAGANGEAAGKFTGTVAPRCILKTPTRDAVTFSQVLDNDGFPIKLSAETGNRLLSYTLRCNGARANITFTHPQAAASNPALAPNTRYFTVVKVSGGGGSTYSTTVNSMNSTTADALILPRSSITNPRTMTVAFALRNGGNANVPLLAGMYTFTFTANIEAGL